MDADMTRGETTVGRLAPPPVQVPSRYVDPAAGFAGGLDAEVRTYIDILRRRSAWFKGVFLVVVGLALAYTLLQDRVYRATSLIEIRGGDGAVPSIEQLFGGSPPSETDRLTHFGLLRSAALAERVIKDLRLDTLEEFAADGPLPMQAIVGAFAERLVVDPVEESRLVSVGFDAASPAVSARTVNAIAETYLTVIVEAREDAARRMATQVDSIEVKLAESEAELMAFAQDHGLPYLVEEDLTAQIGTRLRDLRARLADAEDVRYERESLYDVVRSEGRTDSLEDEVVNTLMLRLSDLQREYARLSATFTDTYPATAEVARQIEHVRALIEEERERLARRVETDYRLSLHRERRIADAIGAEEELANQIGPESGRYHVLRQAVLANRGLLANLDGRRREAEVAAAIGSTDLAVIDPAVPPMQPHRPAFALNLALALMLGLTLGMGAAFAREVVDGTVQSAETLALRTDVPVLGLIPSLGNDEGALGQAWSTAGTIGGPGILPWPGAVLRRGGAAVWPRIDTIPKGDPKGNALADAFGALRTAVLFTEQALAPRSLLVSSCRAGEGKTTVSVNLAMSLTKLGSRVLLVDADLRRPSVHRALRIKSGPGLAACLDGEIANWRGEVRRSGVEGLDVLPAGKATQEAGDLLAGARLAPLIEDAKLHYDFVIVDAPALFINAVDAKLLARHVDGVVVVLRSRSTPRALVDRIPGVVPNVMGIVLNDLRADSLPDYFGEYFAGYGESNGDASKDPVSGAQATTARPPEVLSRMAQWIQTELRRTS